MEGKNKRGYNAAGSEGLDVTEEEMEAFRLKRVRADDPMAAFGSAAAGGGGSAPGGYDFV